MRYTHITQCVTGNAYGLGITPRLGADRLENDEQKRSKQRVDGAMRHFDHDHG